MSRIASRAARLIGLAAACFSGNALGQISVSVDLLQPGDDGFDGLPVTIRCVDVFVDVATTDVWMAAGIRVLAENGGVLLYADGDANTPGVEPELINPGFVNRFATSLSKPRSRNEIARFENAGVALAGGYDPAAPAPTTLPDVLNVAYFASPPETAGSPSVDGYIARIAVDISETGLPTTSDGWSASRIADVPAGATVVLRSAGLNQPWGTLAMSLDDPWGGTSWAMWWIPEPTSGATTLCLLAGWIVAGGGRCHESHFHACDARGCTGARRRRRIRAGSSRLD